VQAVTMWCIGPWAWFVDNVVLPNFVLFALVTFVVEPALGVLLMGLATGYRDAFPREGVSHTGRLPGRS
jgi:hypothetical protein